MGNGKVLLIGLDGATFNLILPWMNRGELPTFSKIIKGGTSGILTSTIPPNSAPAWLSAFTGKKPGNLGIYDFWAQRKGTYETFGVGFQNCPAKALWELASSFGKKVMIVNVPMTFPPSEVNGIMVSGLPVFGDVITYPPTFCKHILSEGYKVDVSHLFGRNEEDVLSEIHQVLEKRAEMMFFLMKKYDWDLFIIVFTSFDRVQHVFWRYIDPNHPAYDPDGVHIFGDAILSCYKKIDHILENVLKLMDEDTTLILMSDHGFEPLNRTMGVNNWLISHSLLKITEKAHRRTSFGKFLRSVLRSFGFSMKTLSNVLLKMRLIRVQRSIADVWQELSFPSLADAVWPSTKAYCIYVGGISINLEGREPYGTVKQGKEYEKLRNHISKMLYELKDPNSGQHVIKRVYKREEIYRGRYLEKAPDLIIIPESGLELARWTRSDSMTSVKVTDKMIAVKSGTHMSSSGRNGVLLAYGRNIKKEAKVEGAEIADITPTVLHIMNIPVPIDVDGKVLKSMFKEGSSPARRKTRFQEGKEEYVREKIPTKEEDEQIKRRLRELGYLG